MEESWRRKWKVVRKWNVIVWKGILFLFSVSWHHSTLLQIRWASVSLKSCPVWFVFVCVLTACVFVTRDTVRHPRRFVFGKFVRKPNCSWSEAFMNRGLTVRGYGVNQWSLMFQNSRCTVCSKTTKGMYVTSQSADYFYCFLNRSDIAQSQKLKTIK